MPLRSIWIAGLLLLGLGCSSAYGLSAREIMQKVNDRDDGDNVVLSMEMILINKNNQKRVRKMTQFTKDRGADSHSVIFFQEPADVENTGFLTYDYDASEKDDDQWMYLPALRKTKRIASNDKSGSFMGSDFNYSDMTKRNLENFEYKIIKDSAPVRGSDTWVISTIPKTEEVMEESGYSKSILWVRKDNFIVIRAKNWVHKSPDIKFFEFKNLKQIDGVWFITETIAKRKLGKQTIHQTVLRQSNIRLNQPLEDAVFSLRRLEKGL